MGFLFLSGLREWEKNVIMLGIFFFSEVLMFLGSLGLIRVIILLVIIGCCLFIYMIFLLLLFVYDMLFFIILLFNNMCLLLGVLSVRCYLLFFLV